jgi:hypothetical protein
MKKLNGHTSDGKANINWTVKLLVVVANNVNGHRNRSKSEYREIICRYIDKNKKLRCDTEVYKLIYYLL